MSGPWNTSNPPVRPGLSANFVAAAVAAVESDVQGVALIFGQSNWGPSDKPYLVQGQADYDALYGSQATATLRIGTLMAFDGLDDGGAGQVLCSRVVSGGTAPIKATLVLSDSVPASAITITAKYAGTRANNFAVKVQTNPVTGANKDLILYESGVEIQRWENVASGYNNNFVTAINDSNSPYVTAALSGAGSRALANITGSIGGAGGFGVAGGGVAGTDGAALVVGDYTTAAALATGYDFDCASAHGVSDPTTQAALQAFIRDYNKSGRRAFFAHGGASLETQATAAGRAVTFDDSPTYATYETSAREAIIVTTDLKRVSDGVVFTSAEMASRVAGYISSIGIRRSPVNAKLTGYQVINPYTPANYELAQAQSIMPFSNDSINRVRIEAGNTAMVTTTTGADTTRPAAHKKITAVATDHLIERTIVAQLSDPYIGQLRNTEDGRALIKSSVLEFLRTLEKQSVLAAGSSSVDLDARFVQTGNAVYLAVAYQYVDTIERILLTVRVR